MKGDCKALRYKQLSVGLYKHSMANSLIESKPSKNKDWRYLVPDSALEQAQKIACSDLL